MTLTAHLYLFYILHCLGDALYCPHHNLKHCNLYRMLHVTVMLILHVCIMCVHPAALVKQ